MNEQTETYVVICREDRQLTRKGKPGRKGRYTLATRRVFSDPVAAAVYAAGIAPGRQAIVVAGRFAGLRFD